MSVAEDQVRFSSQSPQYVASQRRQRAQAIRQAIIGLDADEDRDDFHVVMYPLLESVRNTLDCLLDCPTEGNAREILRLLRDSMMDGGWDRYKDRSARSVAIAVVAMLADAEEVTPRDALNAADTLEDAGFSLAPPSLLETNHETQHGRQEAEVPG
jgi:hypothetical protein